MASNIRVLVVSDVHADYYNLRRAIEAQPTADVIFCLGDGAYDYDLARENYPDRMFVVIKGNCDIGSQSETAVAMSVGNAKIYATHGHLFSDMNTMCLAAEEAGANILLYGHTHIAKSSYVNRLYILNPGSLRGYDGTYGVIDIGDHGIAMNIIHLK